MRKVAIVTGASRGIGRAVAKRLAQDGFVVVVNYLSNAAEAEQAVAELEGSGGNAIAIQADVSSSGDVERLFDETVKKLGSVDIVVHNSGIMPLSPIGKNDIDLFDKVISTNLRGAFLVLAQAAQHIAAGGRIIAFRAAFWRSLSRLTGRTLPRRQASKGWCTCWRTNSGDGTSRSTRLLQGRWVPNSSSRVRAKSRSRSWRNWHRSSAWDTRRTLPT